MGHHYEKMPLEESPWAKAGIHPDEDIANLIANICSRGQRVGHLLTSADSRTADPFMEGAHQAMKKFGIATRGHKISSSSTFRFSDMKEGDRATKVFFIADANAIEAQAPLIGHIQWCMMQELKRHANKHRPVYLIADEASNFKLYELRHLITWARGFGIRIHLFLQNISSFRAAYSDETLSTLQSEAEIQQFLPGTREPEVLRFVEEKLGQESVIVRNRRGDRKNGGLGIDGVDYREDGKPVMTRQQIEHEKRAVTFIRGNKAILLDIIPFSAIAPWRDIVGIDPFHGKKWVKRIKLRIRRSNGMKLCGLMKRMLGRR